MVGENDTAELAGRLREAAGLSPEQARACARLLEEHVLVRLAARSDIETLKAQIETLRDEIDGEAATLVRALARHIDEAPYVTKREFKTALLATSKRLEIAISHLSMAAGVMLAAAVLLLFLAGRVP